jgi:hypothetical protein
VNIDASALSFLADRIESDVEDLRAFILHPHQWYSPFDEARLGRVPPKWRHIDRPHGALATVQRSILSAFLADVSYPPYVAAVAGRGVLHHASPHLGARKVATLDIRDCFPTTRASTIEAVWSSIVKDPALARLLTALTAVGGRLPQGAPTSNALCALASVPSCDVIAQFCQARRVEFSIYVDDLAMSGRRAHECIGPAIEALRLVGYAVSDRKKKLMKAPDVRIVTGIDVSDADARVPADRLHRAVGEAKALAASDAPSQMRVRCIRGFAAWAEHVNADQARELSELVARLPDDGVDDEDATIPRWARAPRSPCLDPHRCKARRRQR